ncbi:MAG TPA: hypothetical protein VIJ15_15680 [Dermatophilaceae bacterium]
MSKRDIIDRSLWGLAALALGLILLPSAVLTLAARQPQNGVADTYGRTMLALIISGAVFVLVGVALELLAWGAAVRHASALADSRWRTVLLWGGVAGIITVPLPGVGVVIFGSVLTAYLVAAPNRPCDHPHATTPTKPVIIRRATRGWAITAAGMLLALAVPNLTNPGRPLHGLLWPSLALVAIGFAVAGIGAVMVGAAWWGALFNTHALPDKTWFRRLRWTGIAAALTMPLFGLGALILLAVFVAYARRAPDSTSSSARPPSGIDALPGLTGRSN